MGDGALAAGARALTVILLPLLTACVSLPGSDSPQFSRYTLQGPSAVCAGGGDPLVLSVTRVNSGLDSDRIARRDADTGEITYLKGVRWADTAGLMAEQRLAQDLECNGFTVLSGHRQSLGQPRLICEVRALNLVIDGGRDEAEVGLSCLFYRGSEELPVVTAHRAGLVDWSADSAVAAISDAYRQVLADLLSALR